MSNRSSMYRDSRWQKKRLEIMERDKFTCQSCGKAEGVTLNVHHAYYESGKKPWEYDNNSMITWCEDCHKMRHHNMIVFQENTLKLKRLEFAQLVFLISSIDISKFAKSALMNERFDASLLEYKNQIRNDGHNK